MFQVPTDPQVLNSELWKSITRGIPYTDIPYDQFPSVVFQDPEELLDQLERYVHTAASVRLNGLLCYGFFGYHREKVRREKPDCYLFYYRSEDGNTLSVYHMHLSEQFKRRGIGSSMLRILEALNCGTIEMLGLTTADLQPRPAALRAGLLGRPGL